MYNYCKTCCHDDGDIGFCDKCYYNHILEEKGIPPTEYEVKPKPQTNADRIRSMTDEELAQWLDDISKACYDEGYTKETDEPQMSPYPCTASKWLNWLKQEATDEES